VIVQDPNYVGDAEPLSINAAKATTTAVAAAATTLLELMETAAVGQIHTAMGFPTFAVWWRQRIAPKDRSHLPTVIADLRAIVGRLGGSS
jgi:hypothetical protein